jgi:hypothetical protein
MNRNETLRLLKTTIPTIPRLPDRIATLYSLPLIRG